MSEWQDISTAPKDGRQILVFAEGVYTTVSWFDLGGYWSLVVCGSFANDSEFFPVLWMPLVPPSNRGDV